MAALESQVISAVMTDVMNQDGYAFDQIFGRIALIMYLMIQDAKPLNKLRTNKRVMESDGGSEIEVALEYADGGTTTNITGMETIAFTQKDVLTNAKEQWAWAFTSGVLDNKDILKAAGNPKKIASLVDTHLHNWMKSLANDLNSQLLAATVASGKFNSLPHFVRDDPTAAATISGIAQNTSTWWQNKYKSSSAAFYAPLLKEITTLRNTIAGGNMAQEKPNLALTDQTVFEFIENYYIGKGTHTFKNEEISNLMNADVSKVKGMDLVWDASVPESTVGSRSRLYLLNTDYCGFRVHKGRKFELSKPMDMMVATQQDATGWTIGLGGQLVCSNRKRQGVLFNIAQTLTN